MGAGASSSSSCVQVARKEGTRAIVVSNGGPTVEILVDHKKFVATVPQGVQAGKTFSVDISQLEPINMKTPRSPLPKRQSIISWMNHGASWEKRLRAARDICEFLHSLHSRGMVHGNLTLSTIYVLEDVVKVSSSSMEEGRCTQDNGQDKDVYALGIVLLSLICGEEHSVPSLLIEKAAIAAAEMKSEETRVSATRCYEIAQHALDPDPSRRYKSDLILVSLISIIPEEKSEEASRGGGLLIDIVEDEVRQRRRHSEKS